MITAERTACKKYTLSSDEPTNGYRVEDVNGSELFAGTFAAGSVKIEVPKAGVYIVVEIVDPEGDAAEVFYTIIEECELITCLKKMLLKIFCQADECADCDKLEIQKIRYELNKLLTGYGLVYLYIFAERVTYTGVFEIDSCRLTRLKQIDQWITDLGDIKERCGPVDCDDNTTTEVTDCKEC